jgi:hypothetical protein
MFQSHGVKTCIWVNHHFIKLCFEGLSFYLYIFQHNGMHKFKIIWCFLLGACGRICIFVLGVKNFSNHAEHIRLPPYKNSVSWRPGTLGFLHLWFIRQQYDLWLTDCLKMWMVRTTFLIYVYSLNSPVLNIITETNFMVHHTLKVWY